MILRRLTQSPEEHSGTAIVVELVVAGMLIGLRADKRNEACRDGRV